MNESPIFHDYNGRQFTIDGGIGGIRTNGTAARIWIWVANRRGSRLYSRSLRLDLPTARKFHAELGRQIEIAIEEEKRFDKTMIGVFDYDKTNENR